MVIYIRDIRNSLSSFYQRTSKTLLYVLSHVQLFATPWTVACQVSLSMGFTRQEYWSGLPCPPQGDRPHPWIEPMSLLSSSLQVDSLLLSHQGNPFLFYLLLICFHVFTCHHYFFFFPYQHLEWGKKDKIHHSIPF